MNSITEEMYYLQRLCEYAIKYGVIKVTRRHHTYRQCIYRQLERCIWISRGVCVLSCLEIY